MGSFVRNSRLVLIAVFVLTLFTPAARANKPLTPEQVRDRIIHRGVTNWVHVLLKDGSEYRGKILKIDPDSFRMQRVYDRYSYAIYGPDTVDVNYADVLTLRAGATAGEKWMAAGLTAVTVGGMAALIAWGIHESNQMKDDYNNSCAQMFGGTCPNPAAVKFRFGH